MRSPNARLLAISFCIACAGAQAQQPSPSKPSQTADQKPPAANLPVVKLIATGGTIAMKIDPVKKAPVPAISGEDLIATVPEIEKVARIEVQNLFNVPSAYMDPEPLDPAAEGGSPGARASRGRRRDRLARHRHAGGNGVVPRPHRRQRKARRPDRRPTERKREGFRWPPKPPQRGTHLRRSRCAADGIDDRAQQPDQRRAPGGEHAPLRRR